MQRQPSGGARPLQDNGTSPAAGFMPGDGVSTPHHQNQPSAHDASSAGGSGSGGGDKETSAGAEQTGVGTGFGAARRKGSHASSASSGGSSSTATWRTAGGGAGGGTSSTLGVMFEGLDQMRGGGQEGMGAAAAMGMGGGMGALFQVGGGTAVHALCSTAVRMLHAACMQ